MDQAVSELSAEQAQLSTNLGDLSPDGWHRATRCEGWDVGDIVLHLAQTNELAIASATGHFEETLTSLTSASSKATSVDEGAAGMVERERGSSPDEVARRWNSSCDELVAVLAAGDMSARVRWVAGELSMRTLAVTRLAETWIHSWDIAEALGLAFPATDRLRPIARLAWRTLPYAFGRAGLNMSGPVSFRLSGPEGDQWDFTPEEPAITTISGPAEDLCAVAARRVDPSLTALVARGSDADAVLALVRTYA